MVPTTWSAMATTSSWAGSASISSNVPDVRLQVCAGTDFFACLAQLVIGEKPHDGAEILERGSSQLDDRRDERQGRG